MSRRYTSQSRPLGGHFPQNSLSPPFKTETRPRQCKFYFALEGCRKGANCPFAHPAPDAGSSRSRQPRRHDSPGRSRPSRPTHQQTQSPHLLRTDLFPTSRVVIRQSGSRGKLASVQKQPLLSESASKKCPQQAPSSAKQPCSPFVLDQADNDVKRHVLARVSEWAVEEALLEEDREHSITSQPSSESGDVSPVVPAEEEEDWEFSEPTGEETISACTAFELRCTRDHGNLLSEFLCLSGATGVKSSPSGRVVQNSFVALGPEGYLKMEELSHGVARMLPSLLKGWTQYRGLREGAYAGCGRTSQISEALSFDLLHRLTGVQLAENEMDIQYIGDTGVPKIDYVAEFRSVRVGVSVTRAVNLQRPDGEMTAREAAHLIAKKLLALRRARRAALPAYRWHRSMLHVWAPSAAVARKLLAAARRLLPLDKQAADSEEQPLSEDSRDLPCDPIMMITVTSFPCSPAYSYIYGKE